MLSHILFAILGFLLGSAGAGGAVYGAKKRSPLSFLFGLLFLFSGVAVLYNVLTRNGDDEPDDESDDEVEIKIEIEKSKEAPAAPEAPAEAPDAPAADAEASDAAEAADAEASDAADAAEASDAPAADKKESDA